MHDAENAGFTPWQVMVRAQSLILMWPHTAAFVFFAPTTTLPLIQTPFFISQRSFFSLPRTMATGRRMADMFDMPLDSLPIYLWLDSEL
jgi:hypothetical protein